MHDWGVRSALSTGGDIVTVELGFAVLAAVLVTLMAVLSSHARRIAELERQLDAAQQPPTPARHPVVGKLDIGACVVCRRPAVVAVRVPLSFAAGSALTFTQHACAEHEAYVTGLVAEHPGLTKIRETGQRA